MTVVTRVVLSLIPTPPRKLADLRFLLQERNHRQALRALLDIHMTDELSRERHSLSEFLTRFWFTTASRVRGRGPGSLLP